ncbi:MAG: class I SAM-dependent methyltransferase [Bacteroidota bacterium]
MRTAYQGVTNILRFNWHFFALAVGGTVAGLLVARWLGGSWWYLGLLVAAGVLLTTLASLVVSWYVYDYSGLYDLEWLDLPGEATELVNIHAGFDETSALLAERYPRARLRVLDFYDPALHTEVSIRRARRAYPPYPGTEGMHTAKVPLVSGSADAIFLLLAAHEIRDADERVAFFRQLRRSLQPSGRIIVLEHLRDGANFLAYTLGFFHFYSRTTWLRTFDKAGLRIAREKKLTPFLTCFTLVADGTSP